MMIHGHGAPNSEPSGARDERNIEDACPVCSSQGVVAEESGERSKFVYHVGPKKGKHGPLCIRFKKTLLLDEEEGKLSFAAGLFEMQDLSKTT